MCIQHLQLWFKIISELCVVVVWGWREKERGERIVDGRTVKVEEEIRSDWVP